MFGLASLNFSTFLQVTFEMAYVTGVVIQSGPEHVGSWVDSFTFSFDPGLKIEVC